MLRRTTNFKFQDFGEVHNTPPKEAKEMSDHILQLKAKSFDRAFFSSTPTYLENMSGITMVALSHDGIHFKKFVLHRTIEIDPNVYFNFVPITDHSELKIYYNEATLNEKKIQDPIEYKPISSKIAMKEIYTNYYYIRKAGYFFPEQILPFYVLLYIDEGEIEIECDEHAYCLKANDCLLLYPDQKLSMHTKSDQNCSYLMISFLMETTLDTSLKNIIIHLRNREVYSLLSKYMKAVQNDHEIEHELAIVYLKEVVLMLFRERIETQANEYNPMQAHYENALFNEILIYIQTHIDQNISVEALCERFQISRSKIQNIFKEKFDIGPKQYISNVKLDRAKEMIQEHKYTISEISDRLGFTSVHYFSRKFKSHFSIAPTDYAKQCQKQKEF